MSVRPASGGWAVHTRAAAVVAVLTTLAVAALTGASPATADDAQVRRYVQQVYLDLFGRDPDPTGLAAWSAALRNGTPRVAVANGITYSEEFRAGLITETYELYLGRGPDPEGLRSWLVAMGRGATIAQIGSGFLASDEYFAQSGNNSVQWVRDMYMDVLGRDAGIQEAIRWSGRLALPGVTRATIARGILLSGEHLSPIVRGYYQQLLGRDPDPTGEAAWVSALQAGVRDEDIIGGIVASDEYWARSTRAGVAGFAIIPGAAQAPAGTRVAYRAAMMDEDGNVAQDVTGAATFTISLDGSPVGACEGARCYGAKAGTYTVTTTWQGHEDSADLQVSPGPAAVTEVVLWNGVASGQVSVPVDASIAVSLVAGDGWTNTWPLTAGLRPTLDGVPCAERCGPITAGAHTLSAVPEPGSGLPVPARSITVTGVTPTQAGSRAFSWGRKTIGLGDGTTVARATPTQIGTGTFWWDVDAGFNHVLARRTDRSLWSWGDDGLGQLGSGGLPRDPLLPQWIQGVTGIDGAFAISAGGDSSIASLSGATLTWGDNTAGQLGNGTMGGSSAALTHLDQSGFGTLSFQVVDAGPIFDAGIADGRLLTWGSNGLGGGLGDGTTEDRPRPGYVGTDTWTTVAVGLGHAVAIRSDGTLWQWGMLVDGASTVPRQVGTRTDWASVDAGFLVSAAVSTSGELWVWGRNDDGQLGDGTTADRTAPVRVGAATVWKQVAFGGEHTAAIATDGSLWTWGRDGVDAAGGAPAHLAPARVGTDTGWRDVTAGYGFTVALRP